MNVIGSLKFCYIIIAILFSCRGEKADRYDSKNEKSLQMEKINWGEVKGKPVYLYTMANANGIKVKITNYGTIITGMHAPDKKGEFKDVVLGFDNLEGYLKEHPYFGATIGRVANRIKDAQFELEGKKYQLAKNNMGNHLHGGIEGFDKKVWNVVEEVETDELAMLAMTYISPDGEEGYPGRLTAQVKYTLTNDNRFRIDFTAETNTTTVVNMVNHNYWNLGGHNSGDILDHKLKIYGNRITESDDELIPTGNILPVNATAFDFTEFKKIGADLEKLSPVEGKHPGGYDINYVLDGEPGELRIAAEVLDPESGILLKVFTNAPGLQFYSGNFLDGTIIGKGGAIYDQHDAFCLETQQLPDAVHHIDDPRWPTVILYRGDEYHHVQVFEFDVNK